MPCYHPWNGYRHKDINPSGKRSITSNPAQALEPDNPIKMACGRCIGCRLKYSAQWATRCYHESQLWSDNAFLTLTFDEEFLPREPGRAGSISVVDCQLFMKRYREKLSRCSNRKIRMAYCGEYGDKNGRPHYHFLIFNHDFEDKYLWRTRNGYRYYRSPSLERLWPFGNSETTALTFDTAAYVARYITKKLHGEQGEAKYWKIDYDTGELVNELTKEFFKTSRRPGLGKGWLDKYASDVYPSDQVVIDGKIFMPPKFYDSQFEIVDPWTMDDVKERRIRSSRRAKALANSTYDRLRVRETCKLAQTKQLVRGFEHGE